MVERYPVALLASFQVSGRTIPDPGGRL